MNAAVGNSTDIVCQLLSEGKVICNGTMYQVATDSHVSPSGWLFWVYLIVYILLVMFAGLMSGLTMGLLSLDILSLEVIRKSGKQRQRKYANRILNLVKQHHLLLVTLLLANAAAVESMPIFLDKITNEIVAIVISVTAVLVFGEIIPQAVCTRFGLAVGYYCSPLVYLLMATFFIISFPIAKLLDCILGTGHGTFFRRTELKELVNIHGNHDNTDNEEPLSYDEVLIVKSALEMRDKTVVDAMKPLDSVFMMESNVKLNAETMNEITTRGYSRIPVYVRNHSNINGILLVKRLIKVDPNGDKRVGEIRGATIKPPSCSTDTPLFDILNMFQLGKSHLYLVYDEKNSIEPELVGIITLEDVIEELLGEEIIDETDFHEGGAASLLDPSGRVSIARAKVQLYRRQSQSMLTTTRSHRNRANSQQYGETMQAPSSHLLPSTRSVPHYMSTNSARTPLLLINADIEPTTN